MVMNELYEFMNSFNVVLASCVLCVAWCGLMARRRGYSAVFYGSLGLFLNFAAIPLTALATREPVLEEEPAGLGFTPASLRLEVSDDPDLVSWLRLYRAIRDSLLFAGLGAAIMVSLVVGWATVSILPTFVTLFEGMSLALPMPTQIMVGFTKFARNPELAPLFWAFKFCWPAGLFYILQRSGYKFPVLGRVWREADRVWQVQAIRKHGEDWRRHVPIECARRMFDAPTLTLPEDEAEYQQQLRRQREALQAALWSMLPAVVPVLGLGMVALWLLGLGIFLPLYQLIGNLS